MFAIVGIKRLGHPASPAIWTASVIVVPSAIEVMPKSAHVALLATWTASAIDAVFANRDTPKLDRVASSASIRM